MFDRLRTHLSPYVAPLGSALNVVSQNIPPTLLSFGTAFSTAGQSLFGTQKICDWIFGLSYFGFEKNENDVSIEPEWAVHVRQAAYAIVITANVIIIVDTRFPAIFRSYFKSSPIAASAATPSSDALEADIEEIYRYQPDEASQNRFTPNDHSAYIVQITHHKPAHDLQYLPMRPEVIKRRIPEQVLVQAAAEEAAQSFSYRFMKSSISGSLKIFGFSSMTFASINTFLGSITLFEYIGVNDPFLKYSFSAFTVACKFYATYSYVYKTATVKSADQLARWVMGERDPLADPSPPINRWDDFKNYLSTLGLSFFNIVSSPYLAFYSTKMTLHKIPFVRDYDDFIFYFSIGSTFSSFTNDIISKSPSVRKAFDAWRSHKEDGSAEIRALNEAQLKSLKLWNTAIVLCGINDSVATGANIVVSVINTSNTLMHIDKYNLPLFLFASTCGVSATLVNYAFSVRRGHRDFLKYEVYPYLAKKGYLARAEAHRPLPDIQETVIYRVMPATVAEQNAAESVDDAFLNEAWGIDTNHDDTRVSLLSHQSTIKRISSHSIFYRHPIIPYAATVEDVTPEETTYNTLAM